MKSAGNLVLLIILKNISITSQNLLDNSPYISKTVKDFLDCFAISRSHFPDIIMVIM